MTVWLLDTAEDEVVDLSAQVTDGDIVVRRRGDAYEVGRAHPGQDEQVTWYGDVEPHLLPETGVLQDREDRTPLQRLDDLPDLEAAVERLEEAERLRGA